MSLLQRAEKQGNKFLNPIPTKVGDFKIVLKLLPLYFNNKAETEPKTPLGPFRTDPTIYHTAPVSGLRVTWFGHSSVLLELDGFRILMDPVWEQRASPVQFMGPKRFFQPTMQLEEMPPLDVVLVSHDHYDHLGAKTIRRLSQLPATQGARWITSLGVAQRLRKFGVPADRMQELDWTQGTEVQRGDLGGSLKVTAWPARHFSGRSLLDRFTTLWSSFVLEGPKHRVYFGGDSGTWPGFADIAAQYEGFDLTLLEIGAFHPLWASIHLGPDGAADAYKQMGGPARAGALLPIHWGLFNLALHGWREPVERMTTVAQQEGWKLLLPTPGEPAEVRPGQRIESDWWRAAAPSIRDVQHGAVSGLPGEQTP